MSIRLKTALEAIDSALFVLCLDDVRDDEPLQLARNLLCGDDVAQNRFELHMYLPRFQLPFQLVRQVLLVDCRRAGPGGC